VLLWLSAVMVPFANACLLHAGPGLGHSPQAAHVADDHDAMCNDAWDAGASAASKLASQDPGGSPAGPALLQSCAVCLIPASRTDDPRSIEAGVLAHGPPAAIRFLRLRL
jgi:hypothetical protein